MKDSEQLAKAIVEHIIPGVSLAYRDKQTAGEYDFEMRYRNPSLVEKWLKEEYPAIRVKAKRIGAAIFFADEAGVRSDFHSAKTWAPRGQTPIVRVTGARFGFNLLSAVSPKGQMRFMVVQGKVNAAQFCEFLRRLAYKAERPIFLILDGHPVHRSAKVKRFVESQKGKLRVFFLPPYSPELNPDESVWNDLKNNACLSGLMTNLTRAWNAAVREASAAASNRMRCGWSATQPRSVN